MAADGLQHVSPGEPLAIQADAYNAFVDAANANRTRQRVPDNVLRREARNSTIIKVQNTTGAALDQYAVATTGDPVILPSDNENEFLQNAAVKVVTADSDGIAVVLLEPLADNAIGRATIQGMTVARISVGTGEESWEYADVSDGETYLVMAETTGPAKVIWKESGTGVKLALVLLGAVGAPGEAGAAGAGAIIVDLATAAALASCTYANGTSGVGATLTASANGALTVDGIAVADGQKILVKDQSSGLQNGVYLVTDKGSVSTPFILTRATTIDESAEFPLAIVNVGPAGDRNKNTEWRCTNVTAPTVGTDSITIAPVNFVTGMTSYGSSGFNTGNIRAASEVSSSVPGNTRGRGSVEWQQYRDNAAYAATGHWSTIIGGFNNTASGFASIAGGQSNEATGLSAVALSGSGLHATADGATIINGTTVQVSGTNSFVGNCNGTYSAGIYSCRITGTRSFMGTVTRGIVDGDYSGIVAGEDIEITGNHSLASGDDHDVSGDFSFAVGDANIVSGDYAVAMGGSCSATADATVATGYEAVARLKGMKAHAYGKFTTVGDAQVVDVILRNTTTNGTPTNLWVDSTTGTLRLTIPLGWSLRAIVNIAAHRQSTGDYAHYVRKVAIANIGGTTALQGAVSTIGTDVESDAAFDVQITADDTNDALQIEVTGKASTTLHWVAHVQGIEIGY